MTLARPELESLRFERRFSEEVDTALSALDCVLLGAKGVYASSELTSGRRAQSLQREHGVPTHGALRDHLGAERYDLLLWNPNAEAALAFAAELRTRLGAAAIVISPAPLQAPGWPQGAYLAFWETLLRTRVRAAYFNDGWEYSNGCVFEFAVALEEGLATLDRAGTPLSLKDGAGRIARAVRELEAQGHDGTVVQESLERLRRLGVSRNL